MLNNKYQLAITNSINYLSKNFCVYLYSFHNIIVEVLKITKILPDLLQWHSEWDMH